LDENVICLTGAPFTTFVFCLAIGKPPETEGEHSYGQKKIEQQAHLCFLLWMAMDYYQVPAPCVLVACVREVAGKLFLREDVKDRPVCLVSIIGEERTGKSFLLNYLMRRLNKLDCSDQGWMGGEDEDLRGFECKPGTNSITKGVFIWNKPFLMDTEQGKIAIFLVDTEGCNSLEREKGISTQLSALSILLSSYMILSIASKINRTDLEFLEMFLDVAQKVGEVLNLDPIQHLDILVRDWDTSKTHGKEAGMKYLEEIQKKMQTNKSTYQSFMKTQLSKAHCFLLPNPGKEIASSSTGHLKDMDEAFRHSLVDYFGSALQSLPTSGRCDMNGSILTGSQLFDQIKLFAKTIEKYSVRITTPLQMSNAFWNMKLREDKVQEFKSFIHEQ
ncbi:RING finger protein 112-like, partial [Carcharodon carcharias]|uniref:RING finger protein 112-like n=1 Tax=Carcharodon carcharias TaxID=13397 RepID=UPI001B7D9A45